MTINYFQQNFLDNAKVAAIQSSGKSGLPPGVTVAQAALESAWGASALSVHYNNYFGLKAHGQFHSTNMQTTEVVNGQSVQESQPFAVYASMEECFEDRDHVILTAVVYQEARDVKNDPEQFVRALAKHWATDPNYAEKILATYKAHDLDQMDKETT